LIFVQKPPAVEIIKCSNKYHNLISTAILIQSIAPSLIFGCRKAHIWAKRGPHFLVEG